MRYQAGLLAGLLSKEIKLVCASLAGAVDRPGSGEYKCTNVVAGDAASCALECAGCAGICVPIMASK